MDNSEEELESASSTKEEKQTKKKEKRKRRLLEEAKKLKRRGVCYLSRIPPKMDPVKLHNLLSQFGEILRIYLVPQDPSATMRRKQADGKRADGFRGQEFSEGWVEFADKHLAKRFANMLNDEKIGGKWRSQLYYDIWNIKYLSKFKWDDLTEEIKAKAPARLRSQHGESRGSAASTSEGSSVSPSDQTCWRYC